MTTRNAFALSAILLTAAVGQAQVPAAQQQPVTPLQNDPNGQAAVTPFRAKQVIGTAVSLNGGERAGVIDDIVFGQDGQIEYLIVADNSQLVTVPFQAARFDLTTRTALLAIPTEKYRAVPRYTVTTYPSFYTPTYRTQVYGYYGLTPVELRQPLLPRRR